MLLAFAWSTVEEQRMANMFPEFIAFDVTSQTNKEKRDLFLAAGLDGNNKTFVPFHCFMPSGSQWVYQWIYDSAIPMLLGKSFTNRNKLALTDGDFCEYVPLEESIRCNDYWKNSTHGLCEYHFLFQAWMKDVSCILWHISNTPLVLIHFTNLLIIISISKNRSHHYYLRQNKISMIVSQ